MAKWVVPESQGARTKDLISELRMVSSRIELGDKIPYGSETRLMLEAANLLERLTLAKV